MILNPNLIIVVSLIFTMAILLILVQTNQSTTALAAVVLPPSVHNYSLQELQQLASNGSSFDAFIKKRSTLQELQQLASNGSSFDAFIKKRSTAASLGPRNLMDTLNLSSIIPAIDICNSSMGQSFAASRCDLTMSTMYEFCQALPNQLSLCSLPAIDDYINQRHLTDGQTDKLAWLFLLHWKELL